MFSGLRPYIAIVEAQIKIILREIPELLSIVFMIYVFLGFLYLGGRVFGGDLSVFKEITGYNDPFRYQLIGVSIIAVSMVMLSSMSQYANTEMLSGRIEGIAMAPISIYIAMAFSSLPFLLSMVIIFGVSLAPIIVSTLYSYGFIPIALSIFALIVSVIPMAMIGLLISFLVLIYKVPQIVNMVQALIFILSGALYPIYILPEILSLIASGLPITHAINISRSLLLQGYIDYGLNGFLVLIYISAVYFVVGYVFIRRLGSIFRSSGV